MPDLVHRDSFPSALLVARDLPYPPHQNSGPLRPLPSWTLKSPSSPSRLVRFLSLQRFSSSAGCPLLHPSEALDTAPQMDSAAYGDHAITLTRTSGWHPHQPTIDCNRGAVAVLQTVLSVTAQLLHKLFTRRGSPASTGVEGFRLPCPPCLSFSQGLTFKLPGTP